jgi:hypothetical protein
MGDGGPCFNFCVSIWLESCICATKLPQRPKSLLEEIVCDADKYNLGTENFLKSDELLKKRI